MLSPFLTASPTDFSSLNTFPAAPASILTLPAPAAAAGFAAGAAAGAAARLGAAAVSYTHLASFLPLFRFIKKHPLK